VDLGFDQPYFAQFSTKKSTRGGYVRSAHSDMARITPMGTSVLTAAVPNTIWASFAPLRFNW
jgi:hypothetical protein